MEKCQTFYYNFRKNNVIFILKVIEPKEYTFQQSNMGVLRYRESMSPTCLGLNDSSSFDSKRIINRSTDGLAPFSVKLGYVFLFLFYLFKFKDVS